MLNAYSSLLGFDMDGEEAYLFHPITGGTDRPMESTNWTGYIKRTFKRLHGHEITPKTLRSVRHTPHAVAPCARA